jgi:hypothetical protein
VDERKVDEKSALELFIHFGEIAASNGGEMGERISIKRQKSINSMR